jgi:NAD(P)-dependent dehydrogenase (short-subunit alcohol dehydrogenase family)
VGAEFGGGVALVTGGGSGIGRASALAFARAGARVVVADVSADRGEETVGLIKSAGGEASFIFTDVSKAGEVQSLIRRTVETYGRLDCAHNNAGFEGGVFAFHEEPEEVWDRVIAINLKVVWRCMQREIAQMLRQGGGAIVNTASVAGLGGARLLPAYCASKHGVIGLTKTAAPGYAAQGIRVNAVCPGIIQTPMAGRLFAMRAGIEQTLLASEPIGRFGTPEEVAAAVVWLCSGAASFVTGLAMPVDGGLVASY